MKLIYNKFIILATLNVIVLLLSLYVVFKKRIPQSDFIFTAGRHIYYDSVGYVSNSISIIKFIFRDKESNIMLKFKIYDSLTSELLINDTAKINWQKFYINDTIVQSYVYEDQRFEDHYVCFRSNYNITNNVYLSNGWQSTYSHDGRLLVETFEKNNQREGKSFWYFDDDSSDFIVSHIGLSKSSTK